MYLNDCGFISDDGQSFQVNIKWLRLREKKTAQE